MKKYLTKIGQFVYLSKELKTGEWVCLTEGYYSPTKKEV